jgi:hypothetical protein
MRRERRNNKEEGKKSCTGKSKENEERKKEATQGLGPGEEKEKSKKQMKTGLGRKREKKEEMGRKREKKENRKVNWAVDQLTSPLTQWPKPKFDVGFSLHLAHAS